MPSLTDNELNLRDRLRRNVRVKPAQQRPDDPRRVLRRHQIGRTDKNQSQPDQHRQPVLQKPTQHYLRSVVAAVSAANFSIERWTLTVERWTFAAVIVDPKITSPLTFEPIFLERIWGGQKLAALFGKKLPADKRIGESWEIVDRPEAQSVVANGPLKGKTLHEFWSQNRNDIFGDVPNAPRFPLLIKILDAQEKLS